MSLGDNDAGTCPIIVVPHRIRFTASQEKCINLLPAAAGVVTPPPAGQFIQASLF